MDHHDPSLWRRLPGPGDAVPEGQADGERARARHHGLRQVRRLSNWTAVGLVGATAVTAGYFARASTSTSASTSPQPPTSVSGSHSKAPASSSSQACSTAVTTAVIAPVAVSGGSGVTTTVPSPSRRPVRPPRRPARHVPLARVAGSRPP